LKEEITKEIDESIETKRKLKLQTSLILEIAENVADSIKNGGKTIFLGTVAVQLTHNILLQNL